MYLYCIDLQFSTSSIVHSPLDSASYCYRATHSKAKRRIQYISPTKASLERDEDQGVSENDDDADSPKKLVIALDEVYICMVDMK